MNEGIEEETAAMLSRHANSNEAEGSADLTNVLSQGRLALRRLRATVYALGGAGVVALGIAAALVATTPWESDSARSPDALGEPPPSAPTTTPTTESSSPDLGPVVPCSTLPRLPIDQEIDTTLNAEGGQLLLSYTRSTGTDESFVIRYLKDPTCQRADIQRVVNRALEATE